MNKNEENSAKSSTWAEEQFRKEADELVKRLETDDRFDDFEPPEELFQKLVVEARDEGLLEEENTKHLEDETKSTEEELNEMIEFISSLGEGVKKIQLLKYHSLGKMKYQWIGKECVEFEEPDELYREHILSKMRELPFYVEWN